MARVRGWLIQAWDLVGADLPLFSLAAFLTISLSLFSFFILAFPLTAGLCIMFLEKLQGRQPQLSQLWEGLTNFFPATIVIWVTLMVAAVPFDLLNYYLQSRAAPWPTVGVGVVFAGLWLVATPLFFTLPLIADRDLSGWDAIKLSWSQVRPRWPSILGCAVVSSLLLLFGVFACGFGIIITLPLVVGALVLTYRDLVGNAAWTPMTPLRETADAEVQKPDENE